ncbi:MAG: ABC transporter substrate-binding protein [Chloroflexota bacterium]
MNTLSRLIPGLAVASLLAACGGGATAPAASPSAASPSSAPSAAASKPAASVAASAAASAKPAAASASAKPAASGAAASAKPVASGGAIPSIPAGQKVKIVTATGVPSVVFTPMWIAIDTGIFPKYGLDASLENIEGVKQAQALIAGDVQVGNVGGAEILNSRAGGANMVAIEETTASPLFEIHAPPEYKKVEDLKGKTMAITQTGSSTDMAARVLLKNHGLEPDKDVKLLNASNMPGILAAMVSKNVQAGTVSPPTTVKADQAGFPKLASALDEHVPLQNNLIAVMKPYADQHPEVVYAYLKAILEANKVYLDKPDVAIASIAKHTDSDQPTSKLAYDAMKPALEQIGVVQEAGIKTVQDYGVNPKIKDLKLSDAYDNTYINNLKASGFTDQIGLK